MVVVVVGIAPVVVVAFGNSCGNSRGISSGICGGSSK